MRERTPRGGQQWSPSSVHALLTKAVQRGLLAPFESPEEARARHAAQRDTARVPRATARLPCRSTGPLFGGRPFPSAPAIAAHRQAAVVCSGRPPRSLPHADLGRSPGRPFLFGPVRPCRLLPSRCNLWAQDPSLFPRPLAFSSSWRAALFWASRAPSPFPMFRGNACPIATVRYFGIGAGFLTCSDYR
jgi:hypothetical protein